MQYNHKNRDFTKEEEVNFIQKGMHTENLRNKLEYAATLSGVDINALVDEIVYAPENNHRRYLENMYGKGSEEVEIGMKIYREKQSEEYKKIIKERESNIEEKNRETETKYHLFQIPLFYLIKLNCVSSRSVRYHLSYCRVLLQTLLFLLYPWHYP